MKKIILLLICAAMLMVCASAFDDIEDETTSHAVATLESMGLVTGTSQSAYSPSLTLTRAQVCTLMIRTKGLEKSVDGYVNQNLFNDVKNNMWHAGYVNLAYREGIINGYGNGYFGPDDHVTYGQFVTILLRLLGYTENDIGKLWPSDYIVFAADLGLDENIDLSANDTVSRGDAAILLYNTIMLKAKGANSEYYRSLGGYSSSVTVLVLDNGVSDSTAGDLYACVLGGSTAEMKYYHQENKLSDTFVGRLGSLLLNSAGKVIGFISDGEEYTEVVVDSAKLSGITDADGNVYKINSSVGVISEGSIYTYGTTGYIKVNSHANKSARFYYGDDGALEYIYLTTGTDISSTKTAVASSDAAVVEIEEALGISDSKYNIVKNGGRTDTAAIAMYDVAYYDDIANTLHISDYKITGYIDNASPSVSAAKTLTVSGCEAEVLQCAWDSLGAFTFGSYVTVLLTDNGYVAAVYPAEEVSQDMYGVLSKDGNSITLTGSGLTMKPNDINANTSLNGSLVKINTADSERVNCSGVAKTIKETDSLSIKEKTVGEIPLAAGCMVYEWGGSGYVYSLSGVFGESSDSLDEIYWTDTLDYKNVSFYHKNSLGYIDILLLNNVTGNYYEYGKLTLYKDENGISSDSGFTNAVTVTNGTYPKGSSKYICTISTGAGYSGIALTTYSKNYSKVSSVSKTTALKEVTADSFNLSDDGEWTVVTKEASIPVSDSVAVYFEATDKWQSGEEGILSALSSELEMTLYYDRTLENGAQIRIIVVNK